MNAESPTRSEASITRNAAAALIAAAHRAAADSGFAAAIAVTDLGGHLRAFERDDEAPFLTSDVAIGKAWTAVSYRTATHVWNEYVTDPKIAPLQHVDGLVAVGGGYPLVLDGQLVGGLGISGGTYEQDRVAAEVAMAAVGLDAPAAD